MKTLSKIILTLTLLTIPYLLQAQHETPKTENKKSKVDYFSLSENYKFKKAQHTNACTIEGCSEMASTKTETVSETKTENQEIVLKENTGNFNVNYSFSAPQISIKNNPK
jgi:hypothetical protein